MKLLWITWKDFHHPQAGGAELVANELWQRLLEDGHDVTMLSCGYKGAESEGLLEGIRVIRVGSSRYLHPAKALAYYIRHLRGQFDVLIEEVSGATPYFSVLFAGKTQKFMLYHQLGRIHWLYEIKRPFSYLGYYAFVPLVTKLASMSRTPVITVSESTKQALSHYGFRPERTRIISEGLEIEPINNLEKVQKFKRPTLLSFGAMRAMKRTLDQIKSFELAKQDIPNLQFKLAGSSNSAYGKKVLEYIQRSPFAKDISYLGPVSDEEKIRLMQKSHLAVQTAIEEGWGLTITEAASQGTPAAVYDVAGLRDSVRDNETGIITEPTPKALATATVGLLT